MTRYVIDLLRDEDGMTTVEYALLLGFVATLAMAGWSLLAARVSSSADASQSRIAQ